MTLLALVLVATGCPNPSAISVDEAKQLVRQAAVLSAVPGTVMDVEVEETNDRSWLLRAYATNTKAASSLIGYYSVNKLTASVSDVSGEPPFKRVTTRALRRMQADIRQRHCGR
jgi:hypothetical protein